MDDKLKKLILLMEIKNEEKFSSFTESIKQLDKQGFELMSKYIGKEGIIESLKYDKYGRWLCEVYIEDKNISDELLSLWYAKQRDWKWVRPI